MEPDSVYKRTTLAVLTTTVSGIMNTMAEPSAERHDYSSNQGVASIKSDNTLNYAEIYNSSETELNEDIDLSKSVHHKAGTSCEQSQNLCNSAVESNETLVGSSHIPSTASIQGSRVSLEGSENSTRCLQTLSIAGFQHDQCLNVYYKQGDHAENIISGVDNSVNNKEIVRPKDSEVAAPRDNNYDANRERGNHFEEESFESEKGKSSNEDSSFQSQLWRSDKLKLVVIDEHETEQQRLDHLKAESNKIRYKTPADCEEEAKQNEGTVESIEGLMKYLLSFAFFKVRDVLLYMIPTVKWHPQSIDDIPWNWLKEEKWRLHTYSRYPHGANKSAILLAEAGFAYLGSGKGNDDKVICYFCCAVKQEWHASDVISEVHRHLSPDCSMVTGINNDNVPMTMPKSGLHLFSRLHESRETFVNDDARQKAQDDIDRDGLQSSHANAQLANGSSEHSSTPSEGSNRNNAATPVRHSMMATQTIMRPSTSLSNSQSVTGTARFSQPTSSNVPSTTVTSNSILSNATSVETDLSGSQTAAPQEGQNLLPAEAQIVNTSNQNVHQVSDQTAVSSSTVVSQVSHGDSTHDQNSSTITVASVASSTTTTTSSTTAVASSSLNTSVSQTATLSQENVRDNTSDSQNSSRTAGRNPTYGELGIITERPKRYEFAVRAKRLESFEPWPRDHHLKKEDLADAGFYYAGYGDCARCFYCGGGLRNWEDNDNVWVEHARWFPKCAFIRQTMGQQFVDAVQDLNKSHDQITFEMVTNIMGSSAASFQLDTKNMPLKRDPAVITVLGMGYEDKDVLEAANFVKESWGILSADKLFEKLEQDGKRRRKTESPAESQAIRNSTESKDEEVMNQLKEQNNQLRQQTVCKICMDKEVAVVFLPCGHLISCTDCAAALKDCPVCRNLVRGIVRAFMA
ncbi:hypothetical protein BsWGS_11692 [Bradybaena similaris]